MLAVIEDMATGDARVRRLGPRSLPIVVTVRQQHTAGEQAQIADQAKGRLGHGGVRKWAPQGRLRGNRESWKTLATSAVRAGSLVSLRSGEPQPERCSRNRPTPCRRSWRNDLRLPGPGVEAHFVNGRRARNFHVYVLMVARYSGRTRKSEGGMETPEWVIGTKCRAVLICFLGWLVLLRPRSIGHHRKVPSPASVREFQAGMWRPWNRRRNQALRRRPLPLRTLPWMSQGWGGSPRSMSSTAEAAKASVWASGSPYLFGWGWPCWRTSSTLAFSRNGSSRAAAGPTAGYCLLESRGQSRVRQALMSPRRRRAREQPRSPSHRSGTRFACEQVAEAAPDPATVPGPRGGRRVDQPQRDSSKAPDAKAFERGPQGMRQAFKPTGRPSAGSGHIIISGTGRAGTTLLVQLFTHLGFDTGFGRADSLRCIDSLSHAGLEHSLRQKLLPHVIKSPWLVDELPDALAKGTLPISAAIVPIRQLSAAAESRRGSGARLAPAGLIL